MTDAHATHSGNNSNAHHEPHGDGAAALGPIDMAAWGAGILGVAIGLVIAFCFALGVGVLGAAV